MLQDAHICYKGRMMKKATQTMKNVRLSSEEKELIDNLSIVMAEGVKLKPRQVVVAGLLALKEKYLNDRIKERGGS